MRFKLILVSALLLTSIPLLAGTEVELRERPEVADALEVLDMWIEQQVAHRNLPGLSIAIVFDQEIVWAKGYGYSDLEKKIPATPATVYRIGSVTKLFTSTAILQLRDQGKLRLDDPVSLYLPWFRVRNPFPDAPEITIRQLLTHTSGLGSYWEALFNSRWTEIRTVEALIDLFADDPLLFEPGERFEYSNSGFAVAGLVIEKVSGQVYYDYVREHIFKPAGMEHTDSYESGVPFLSRFGVHLRRSGKRRRCRHAGQPIHP